MSEGAQMPPSTDSDEDPSIPLLTDRIFLPAVELDTALPASLTPGEPAATAAGPQEGVAVDEAVAAAEEAVPAQQATAPDDSAADEAAVEAELDRDLVAASDDDFEALLSAEQPLAAAEAATRVVSTEEAPPIEAGVGGDGRDLPAAAAPMAGDAAIEAQAEALRAAVLQRVSARLPEQVSAAVRDLMQPAIDQAMARLGEEAEVALRIALQELVEQALREELQQRPERPPS
jgi:hypothetical protein